MASSTPRTPRPLTGRKVLIITVSAFAVVVGVNLALAWNAVATFPGLEVQNSYVASQGFDRRLAEQQALGWTTDAELVGGHLTLRITDRAGNPVQPATLHAVLGRPTTEREDTEPALRYVDGTYIGDVTVDYGNWNLHLRATAADGSRFQQRIGLIHRRS